MAQVKNPGIFLECCLHIAWPLPVFWLALIFLDCLQALSIKILSTCNSVLVCSLTYPSSVSHSETVLSFWTAALLIRFIIINNNNLQYIISNNLLKTPTKIKTKIYENQEKAGGVFFPYIYWLCYSIFSVHDPLKYFTGSTSRLQSSSWQPQF